MYTLVFSNGNFIEFHVKDTALIYQKAYGGKLLYQLDLLSSGTG